MGRSYTRERRSNYLAWPSTRRAAGESERIWTIVPAAAPRSMEGRRAEETGFWHGGAGTHEGLPARGSGGSGVRCGRRRPGKRKGWLERRTEANMSFVTVR